MSFVKTILEGNKIEYDDTEFEIVTNCYTKEKYLHYIGEGKDIHNPKGNISCYCMFEDFKGTELDLSKFNTSEITNMSFMFNKCYNLKHLNLSNFNTHNVFDMSFMFHACMNLKELDISNFYIGNTKILDGIFWDCKSLEALKVSSDCLQFFSMNRVLLEIGNNVNIIPASKLDKAVENLFY